MRRLAVVVVVACLTMVGLATPAFAHNTLIASNPADEATVQESPATIELTFDQPVQKGDDLNTIAITGPENTVWSTGAVEVASNVVTASVADLGPAGVYQIGYRILSADGHPVSGDISFTLATAGEGTPEPEVEQTTVSGSPDDGDGLPIWVWILGAAVLLGAGLTVALRMGGKQPR